MATTYALPNTQITPGAISDDKVEIVCTNNYDKLHRPNAQMSYSLKLQAMTLYNVPYTQIHTIEADALIPVAIGGNHFALENIWPQKCDRWSGHRCVAGDAYAKDRKEVQSRRNICTLFKSDPSAAQALLLQYQHQFATDWRQVR